MIEVLALFVADVREEQLKAFLESVKADASLQEKLKAAADVDAVAAIAKEAGFSISAEDLTNAQSELSEEELEELAGGTADWFTPMIDKFDREHHCSFNQGLL